MTDPHAMQRLLGTGKEEVDISLLHGDLSPKAVRVKMLLEEEIFTLQELQDIGSGLEELLVYYSRKI
jgi:hypothetical protein